MRPKKGHPLLSDLWYFNPTPTRESVFGVSSGAQYITGSLSISRGLMVITHGRTS